MDYEKYYKISQDGTYSIHFVNKKGFSKEQISNMFSSYGNVSNLTWKGDINGLVFIKYKTLQETLYCLEDLQKSNDIRILPQKDKISKQKIQQSSDEWQAGRMDNTFQETLVIDKQHHSNSLLNTYSNKNLTCEEKPTSHKTGPNCADNFSNSSFLRPKYDYKSWLNAINSNKFNSLIVDEKSLQDPKQQNYDNKVLSCNQVTKQQEIGFQGPLQPEEKPYSIQDKDTSNSKKVPSLIFNSETKPKWSDMKIDYSLPPCTDNDLSKSIILMQEVIVANIHINYGIHYILHLFEKYSPISATLMKTILNTDIRYCSVYFMNRENALAIEKEFDKFTLSGRNLIVLRKSQLSKAICK